MSTIKDVAKYAGVSIATVSYVLNGTKFVLPETKEKVLSAAKALNYSPNPTAQSFKTGKKKAIAFIIPDISNNFFANITKSLENTLRNYGYFLILVNTNENLENELQQLKYMTSGIVDGILLASAAQNYSDIKSIIPKGFPIVLVDRKLEDCPYDTICASDQTAFYYGIKRLYEKGHKRIGYIGDTPHLSTAIERQQAYLQALDCLGIDIDESIILHSSSLTHDAYKLTGQLLQSGCSAVVTGNNIITIDAYSYILHHQIKYPNAEILGFEHKDLSPHFYSNTGSIALNEVEIGQVAGEQIIYRLKNPNAAQKEIVINTPYLS